MSTKAARARIPLSFQRKDHNKPVMFFGTLEVAYQHEKDVTKWKDGISQNFQNRGKGNKRLMDAITKVRHLD